jgi:hypothetical protein
MRIGVFPFKLGKFSEFPLPKNYVPSTNSKGIGFTGSRHGMNKLQLKACANTLKTLLLKSGNNILHFGDCVGADEQAFKIAKSINAFTVVHPPLDSRLRTFCEGDYFFPKKESLERSKNIVNYSTVLVATPSTMKEEVRSGTWSTIRYARKQYGKMIYIIFPDSSVKLELPDVDRMKGIWE